MSPVLPSSGNLSGKRVLIVEDDKLLQNLLSNTLSTFREMGTELLLASDGKEAYELTIAKRPDVILLDLLLPQMSGFEFLEAIQKEDPTLRNVPVIVFSNLNTDADKQRAKELGVRYFLFKADCSIAEIATKLELFLTDPSSSLTTVV